MPPASRSKASTSKAKDQPGHAEGGSKIVVDPARSHEELLSDIDLDPAERPAEGGSVGTTAGLLGDFGDAQDDLRQEAIEREPEIAIGGAELAGAQIASATTDSMVASYGASDSADEAEPAGDE